MAALIRMPRSDLLTGLGVFVAAASLYVLLRTQQYLAVDGAIRCLYIYWHGRPMAGGNNHLLYFVDVFVWTRMLSFAGVRATNAFDFMRLTQFMNALAAAGSIAMFWLLCHRATKDAGVASIAAGAYAFSNAFLLHATSTAEPMLGLFWSFASVSAVASGLAVSSRPRLFAGGVLLLLAMATYESMVLIGPAELVLIFYWDERRSSHNRIAALWFLGGCIAGGIAAYVPVYALSGSTVPLAMWHRFLGAGGGTDVYGGMSAAKLINLPMGFANGIVSSLPVDYQGVRAFLRFHHHDRWMVLTSTAVILSAGWLVWTWLRFAFVWAAIERRLRLILGCCAVALVFDLLPLIFWDPLYDKLWLQPVAVVLFAWGVIFAAWLRLYQWGPISVAEATLVVVILTVGFVRALESSRSSPPCLAAARHLDEILRSSDLLVAEWEPVSVLYSSFWGDGAKRFDLPTSATENGTKTLLLLDDEISRTRASGGRVYFLGVLDMPEVSWKPFLADKCHLPYHSLDGMRRCAKPVARLRCSNGDEVLWQLPFGCRNL
jgi:hypothetical protein